VAGEPPPVAERQNGPCVVDAGTRHD
jgi:hypothetical protein